MRFVIEIRGEHEVAPSAFAAIEYRVGNLVDALATGGFTVDLQRCDLTLEEPEPEPEDE